MLHYVAPYYITPYIMLTEHLTEEDMLSIQDLVQGIKQIASDYEDDSIFDYIDSRTISELANELTINK